MNSRGRRGSALGMPARRLRGGFQASMLPGLSNGSGRCTGAVRPNVSGECNSGGSQSSSPNTASRNLQSSDDHTNFNGDDLMSSMRNVFAMCRSVSEHMKRIEMRNVFAMCRSVSEHMKRIEQRIKGVEQNQLKTREGLKDIIKEGEKTSFAIKGSTLEVT